MELGINFMGFEKSLRGAPKILFDTSSWSCRVITYLCHCSNIPFGEKMDSLVPGYVRG